MRPARDHVLAKAWLAGRTAVYRGETTNPYPKADFELQEAWERGRREAVKPDHALHKDDGELPEYGGN